MYARHKRYYMFHKANMMDRKLCACPTDACKEVVTSYDLEAVAYNMAAEVQRFVEQKYRCQKKKG